MVRRSNRFKTAEQTLNELNGSTFSKMSRAEMAREVSKLASAANKRIARMAKAGQPIEDTVKKFSVAGKNKNELMKEFSRVKGFMQSPQQSLRGQARIASKTVRGLAKEISGKKSGKVYREAASKVESVLETDKQKDKFWRAYEKLKEVKPEIATNKRLKYRVLQKQVEMVSAKPGMRKDTIFKKMQEAYDGIYKEIKGAEARKKEEDTSDAFTM